MCLKKNYSIVNSEQNAIFRGGTTIRIGLHFLDFPGRHCVNQFLFVALRSPCACADCIIMTGLPPDGSTCYGNKHKLKYLLVSRNINMLTGADSGGGRRARPPLF